MATTGQLLRAQQRAAARWTKRDAEEARRARSAGEVAVAARELLFPHLHLLPIATVRLAIEWQERAIRAYQDGDTPETLATRVVP